MEESKRKGARSIKDISPEILQQLNQGELETANLVEWLAIDSKKLLKHLLQQHNRLDYLSPISKRISLLKKQTVNTVNETIGTGLFEQMTQHNDLDFFKVISAHKADMIRCWATYTIGRNSNLDISEALNRIQAFAADDHFGVREISWLAVRTKITQNLEQSITILSSWTANENANIRRFASEATRSRGVWCEHIEALKKQPEMALPILNPLKNDPAKYVQDSVGNWLNDASKSRPDFVKAVCSSWSKESNTKATAYIIKRALRTIEK